jgi:hypothetical protein
MSKDLHKRKQQAVRNMKGAKPMHIRFDAETEHDPSREITREDGSAFPQPPRVVYSEVWLENDHHPSSRPDRFDDAEESDNEQIAALDTVLQNVSAHSSPEKTLYAKALQDLNISVGNSSSEATTSSDSSSTSGSGSSSEAKESAPEEEEEIDYSQFEPLKVPIVGERIAFRVWGVN